MLAGFETPTSGRILIDGQDMAEVPPWKRPANMMFQSYALFPHMSVADNIAFGLKQDGVPKSEIKDRVAEAVKLVQLEGREHRRPDQLSGGQKQRVALARAIIKRPKVLLLDEPLGALDKKLRERTQFELVNIQESLGLTFVIVTHDQEEAMTVSTRMAIMNEGRVGQLGTPGEMYEYPTSRFVADFLGDVNVLEARVVEAGRDQVRVHSAQAGCDIVADRGDGAGVGRDRLGRDPAGEVHACRRTRRRPDRRTAWPARSGTSAISATSRSTMCAWPAVPWSAAPRPTGCGCWSGRSPGRTGCS